MKIYARSLGKNSFVAVQYQDHLGLTNNKIYDGSTSNYANDKSPNFFLYGISPSYSNKNSSIISIVVQENITVSFLQVIVGSPKIENVTWQLRTLQHYEATAITVTTEPSSWEETVTSKEDFKNLTSLEKLKSIYCLQVIETNLGTDHAIREGIGKGISDILKSIDFQFLQELKESKLCNSAVNTIEYLRDKGVAEATELLSSNSKFCSVDVTNENIDNNADVQPVTNMLGAIDLNSTEA